MKKTIILILSILSINTFAQKSFYEALNEHGEDAVYQRYYSVYEDDEGKQKISGKQYKLKAQILKHDGVYSGIKMIGASEEDKAGMYTLDATKSKSYEIIGYPNVSHLVNRSSRKGFVVVDDFIFKIGNVWKAKDGLGFNDIDEIYIKIGGDGNTAKDDKKAKKKKFGKFMSQLKDAAMNKPISECTSLECKKAESMDLGDLIRDYLKQMKSKQDAYTLTTQDKADIAKIEGGRTAHNEHVTSYNDQYKRKPEYHRVLQNNMNAQSSTDRKNLIRVEGTDAKVDNCKYYIKNNSSTTFKYVNASQKIGTIPAGKTQEFNCYYLAFIAEGKDKGKLIVTGGQGSRDDTYIVK